MNISKKQLVTLGIPALICVGCILLDTDLAFAEELKEVDIKTIRMYMEEYLSSGKYDFLGRGYDKEFFKLIKEYAGMNPFKQLAADIGTFDLQARATSKVVETNSELYMVLGSGYGFRFVSPEAKVKFLKMSGKMLANMFKTTAKIFFR